jgi:hypothetical protein
LRKKGKKKQREKVRGRRDMENQGKKRCEKNREKVKFLKK